MDKVLINYYSSNVWICGETYESLIWNDKTTEKPTEEELNIKWAELKKEQMREKRNELLKECDFKFVSDYPHSSDEKKQEWLSYRQSLRDFPSVWEEGMEYPLKPE
jgi:hypothetical protein